MLSRILCLTLILTCLTGSLPLPAAAPAAVPSWEHGTYSLTESTGDYRLWTTLPTEKVFMDSPIPTETASGIKLYAAKNEFEPFIVVVNPTTTGTVSVTLSDFPGGITTEIYQVKYVHISTPSDYLGRTGANPDPLWPLDSGDVVNITAGENTAFWFSVHVPEGTAAGDYPAAVTIGGVSIPVTLHVFDFSLPAELHIKSQMNLSYQQILNAYGVTGTGTEYWTYVQKINQFLMDRRLTPKSPLWPGGLTGGGAAPFIDYYCSTHTLSDPYGIWGFEIPANRYIDGVNFPSGVGFPSFMAATFRNNDASADQRPDSFCEITRSSGDWYAADNPITPYNQAWFTYVGAVETYLTNLGYIDEAYYYFANEPQNQDDYDAVAWYAENLKNAASTLKLAVSEEPKPEIYDHPVSTGAKIDIWIAHYGYHWDPAVSLDRLANHNEETWLYWLEGTRLPYFNPFNIDHPGEESKLPGWFFWKHRLRGTAYYSFINWSTNPWSQPRPNSQNGETNILYPPSEANLPIAYGSNGHRFVPSIRLELMRDGLEDYEYFYLLNGNQHPQPGQASLADSLVGKIVAGKVEINRDGAMIYNLRRLVGHYLSGDITRIPDIAPESRHPRSDGPPASWYINFQDPAGEPTGTLIFDGQTYLKIGDGLYDSALGYGWWKAAEVPEDDFTGYYDPWYEAEPTALMTSSVLDSWGRTDIFEFDLPNGTYLVTIGVGYRQPRTHSIWIEGVKLIDQEANLYNEGLIRSTEVTVTDKSLTLSMGEYEIMGFINFLQIEATALDPSIFIPLVVN